MVFPAPFGPRSATISPVRDLVGDVVESADRPERLRDALEAGDGGHPGRISARAGLSEPATSRLWATCAAIDAQSPPVSR